MTKEIEKLAQEYIDKSDPSLNALLQAYLKRGREPNKEEGKYSSDEPPYDWSKIEKNFDIKMVFLLVENCKNKQDLAYVAAGPLQDLIELEDKDIVEVLDIMARRSINMRKALEGVWINPNHKSYPFFKNLLNKYGLTERSL